MMRTKQGEIELKNPFLVYGYVSPRYFCDREEECKKMLSALDNERNVTLIAPRRIVKTGLIKTHTHISKPDCFTDGQSIGIPYSHSIVAGGLELMS
jgi:hypothetical protein